MTTTNLPSIQKAFVNHFDGTLISALTFANLDQVLNPTFTTHYFYVSGTCDENTITTKSTDGSFAYNGPQTEEQMANAYKLAAEIRAFIISKNPQTLETLLNNDIEAMRAFGKKISSIRKRASFLIDGKIFTVSGLQLK